MRSIRAFIVLLLGFGSLGGTALAQSAGQQIAVLKRLELLRRRSE